MWTLPRRKPPCMIRFAENLMSQVKQAAPTNSVAGTSGPVGGGGSPAPLSNANGGTVSVADPVAAASPDEAAAASSSDSPVADAGSGTAGATAVDSTGVEGARAAVEVAGGVAPAGGGKRRRTKGRPKKKKRGEPPPYVQQREQQREQRDREERRKAETKEDYGPFCRPYVKRLST